MKNAKKWQWLCYAFFLSINVSTSVHSQTFVKPNNNRGITYNGIMIEKELYIPNQDTAWTPLKVGALVVWSNNLYSWNGSYWNNIKVDTLPLHQRINAVATALTFKANQLALTDSILTLRTVINDLDWKRESTGLSYVGPGVLISSTSNSGTVNALQLRNSSNNPLLTVASSGTIQPGTSAPYIVPTTTGTEAGANISNTGYSLSIIPQNAATTNSVNIRLLNNSVANNAYAIFGIGGGGTAAITNNTGSNWISAFKVNQYFAPSGTYSGAIMGANIGGLWITGTGMTGTATMYGVDVSPDFRATSNAVGLINFRSAPQVSQATATGPIRGFYHIPSGTITGPHIAIENTTGENYYNSTSGNTGIGYASGSTLPAKLSVNGKSHLLDSLTIAKYKNSVTGDSVLTTDVNGRLKLIKPGGASLTANQTWTGINTFNAQTDFNGYTSFARNNSDYAISIARSGTEGTGNPWVFGQGVKGPMTLGASMQGDLIVKSYSDNGSAVGNVLTLSNRGKLTIQTVQPIAGGWGGLPAQLELKDAGSSIVLASPNGTRYKIAVADGGTLTVTTQ